MRRVFIAALSALLAFTGVTIGVGAASASGCPSIAYFAVGGNGDPGSRYVPHVPGGWRMNITYPADVSRGDVSRNEAVRKLDREGRAMRIACPATRIGVYAYSLGASAASRVVDYWQSNGAMSRNTFAVFYGNPRHPVGRDGWGGIEAVGLPSIPGVYSWWGARRGGPIPVTDVCNARRDFVCSSPAPLHRDLPGAWGALDGYLGTGHTY
ncbi:serine hydrolase [Gordonia phage Gsput1]|uniref:Lysin B n=1 Tax=Gordonia phage Gsput1 TaxID=1622193 RepID=A0A0E3XBM4_9CAUD|nr:serine hydrolase [Gordonia phage Gsput1]AKC03028.1 serine hydrolase [Gordonia phage Gsput1]